MMEIGETFLIGGKILDLLSKLHRFLLLPIQSTFTDKLHKIRKVQINASVVAQISGQPTLGQD
jgi:hypothetical protein